MRVDSINIFGVIQFLLDNPLINGGERVYDTGVKLQHGANINLPIREGNVIINAIG